MQTTDKGIELNPEKVITSWICSDKYCQDKDSAEVDLTFFEYNGTPVCTCGSDMTMTKTELHDSEVIRCT